MPSLLLLVFLLSVCTGDEEYLNIVQKLKAQLLKKSCYDRKIPPTTRLNEPIEVELYLMPLHINLDEHGNQLEATVLFDYTWTDEFLKWNPADYDGIGDIKLPSTEIWVPDITSKTYSYSYFTGVPDTMCTLDYNGTVLCVGFTTLSSHCFVDIRKWPYDEHKCVLQITSLYTYKPVYKLVHSPFGHYLDWYNENGDWDIVDMYKKNDTGHARMYQLPVLEWIFVVRRHATMAGAVIIAPAVVLAVLSVLVFWMDAASSGRVYLCMLSVLLHICCMHYLGFNVPDNGEQVPLIVLYFHDSLIMVSVCIMEAVAVRGLFNSKFSPPTPLVAATTAVRSSFLGIMVSGISSPKKPAEEIEEEDEGLVESTKATSSDPEDEWRILIIIIDRLFSFVYVVVYGIMLFALIP